MNFRIGITITNHVCIVTESGGRSVLGTWRKINGIYVAKIKDEEIEANNIEELKSKIQSGLNRTA